ncbi:hypothetical protein KCP70_17025 [Salmonella enterica subsp. enterica]|nr:hypothetical protein KCP70_17025 [Salmonella enterica subsp. enterica]
MRRTFPEPDLRQKDVVPQHSGLARYSRHQREYRPLHRSCPRERRIAFANTILIPEAPERHHGRGYRAFRSLLVPESHLHPVTQRRIAIRELKHQRLTGCDWLSGVKSELSSDEKSTSVTRPLHRERKGLATVLPENVQIICRWSGNISAHRRMQAAPCNNACLLAITDNPPA